MTKTAYIVQVNTGNGWRKRRDMPVSRDTSHWIGDDEYVHEGSGRARAERLARACENAPRRSSCSDGYPHRVVEVQPATAGSGRGGSRSLMMAATIPRGGA
jgi:hypothetical protein